MPPYSSTRMARWNFSACISRIRRASGLVSGRNFAGRSSGRTGAPPRPSRSARTRSFVKATPSTSSTEAPTTGSREKPCSMATSSACVTVLATGTVTMSGRGTITSRATVSPNVMIDSMSSRSSSAITSSSTAASTIPSSSCSDTNGPLRRPRPGMMTLVSPMSARDTARSGVNETSAPTGRAANRAARSGASTAHVFGRASVTT